MRTSALLLGLLLIFGISASAADRSLEIKLDEMNGSGEAGTATLSEQGEKTLVVVTLSNGLSTRQPSHLHEGTCDDYTPRPAYGLSDVVNGRSRTLVNAPFDRLTSGALIVNVHKSYDDIATQASCGVVKR
jgi:hypothetical protein